MNVTHEEGQVSVIPDTKEGGVKHVSTYKTLTQHVILAKRIFAPREKMQFFMTRSILR